MPRSPAPGVSGETVSHESPDVRWPWLVAGLSGAWVVAAAVDEPAQAVRDFTVADVVVEGCVSVHPDRVRFILSLRPGRQLSREALSEALSDDTRAILHMGPFADVKTELAYRREGQVNRVTVTFRVSEVPLVGDVQVAGLGYFQRSGVEDQLTTKSGGYLNPALIESDRRSLERYFKDKGHQDVRVTVNAPVTSAIASVTFTVDLGDELQVGKVRYPGLPARVLERNLDERLINQPGRPYQPELVESDQEAVRRALQDIGYLDAVVRTPDLDWYDFVAPHEDRRRHGPQLVPDGRRNDRVVITLPLAAGELWYLGSVSFVGNTVAGEAEMRTAFGLPDEQTVYKRTEIDRAVERARRLISNQGYARADLRVDARPDRATRRMHLTLHVFEGDLYTVDRIDIHGNYRTKDAVVRRAFAIHPGDLWNDDKVDESRKQLVRADLFKKDQPPRLTPKFDDDRPGHLDLVADVIEDSTGNVRFQLGYSSAVGVFGEVAYGERNFDIVDAFLLQGWRGGAQQLDISAFLSGYRTNVTLAWKNPHVWDGPWILGARFSRTDSSIQDWDERRISSTGSFGRNFLGNDLRIEASYTYSDITIDDVAADAPDDALAASGESFFTQRIGLTENYDRLDHPRLPTRGFRLTLDQGLIGEVLSSSVDAFEYTAKADVFLPLGRAEQGGVTYLHLGGRWRQIEAIGDTARVPFFERLYGGGPSPRHRGFGPNDLGPTVINQNGLEAAEGGTTDALFTAEVSIPLQGTNDGLRFVLFADYGNVYGEDENLDLLNMRTAIGFGIRFPIQLPIALDFAWLVDAKDNEDASQIHFSLGFFSF